MTLEVINKLIDNCNLHDIFTNEKFERFGFNILKSREQFISYNLIKDYSEDEVEWHLREDLDEDIAQWFYSCNTEEEYHEWYEEYKDNLNYDEEVILLLEKYAEKY
ncbi:MAG: hypothetical protein RR942_06560 [Romboutsia sp.]